MHRALPLISSPPRPKPASTQTAGGLPSRCPRPPMMPSTPEVGVPRSVVHPPKEPALSTSWESSGSANPTSQPIRLSPEHPLRSLLLSTNAYPFLRRNLELQGSTDRKSVV